MLLQLDSGIFYEFVAADDFFTENPKRHTISQVQLGINYVLLISTSAGLWGYNIGDTVEFTSLTPYRVIVTGRIKHYISAFGEHVIAKEVETAMKQAMDSIGFSISEFTVAPQTNPTNGELAYHEWFIEFENTIDNLPEIAQKLDAVLQRQNSYYKDLLDGNMLQQLKISPLEKGAFQGFMKSQGKLGGQNKVPRLSNDRKIADSLAIFKLKTP
jgi:hypothetical protein